VIQGLGRPENRHILQELRTAREWGVPLSTIRGNGTPGVWKPQDRFAALALLEYEATLHACGYPRDLAFNPDMSGWFEVDDTNSCAACAALDEYRREHESDPPIPGQVLHVINTRPDDDPVKPWPDPSVSGP
jgi:hypothetical protein